MDVPLAHHPIVLTSEVAEAQTVLSSELADLRIKRVRNVREFRLAMNGIHFGRTQLLFNEFRSDTLVEPDEVKEAMLLFLGVGTPATVTLDGAPIVCDRDAAVLAPSRRVSILRPDGSGALIVRASFDAIVQTVGKLLDRRPSRPVVFDRRVDLTSGVGAHARRVTHSLAQMFSETSLLAGQPLLRAGFDELAMSLLLSMPNNYSRDLEGLSERPVAPGLVRQVEEYLEAHVREPVTVADLVRRFGCSRAALFAAFRRYRRYTPMQFLGRCRLEAAHAELSSSSPGATVSSIAHAFGFAHVGRFAAAYRKRYGEAPSAVLRRATSRIDA